MIAIAPPHPSELHYYTDWLDRRKLKYVVLGPNTDCTTFAALMLCGGADLGARPERDRAEHTWFKQTYGIMPVLGICRGMQLANVALGGTIYENLGESFSRHTSIKLGLNTANPVKLSSFHAVRREILNENNENEFDQEKFIVNSRHHQGIEKVAEGLVPIFWSASDGLVEALSGKKSLFVQWHPEREEMYETEGEKFCYEWLFRITKT